jgi:hypothetical protein
MHSCNKVAFIKAIRVGRVAETQGLLKYIKTMHELASHASMAFKYFILKATAEDLEGMDICNTYAVILHLLNKGRTYAAMMREITKGLVSYRPVYSPT